MKKKNPIIATLVPRETDEMIGARSSSDSPFYARALEPLVNRLRRQLTERRALARCDENTSERTKRSEPSRRSTTPSWVEALDRSFWRSCRDEHESEKPEWRPIVVRLFTFCFGIRLRRGSFCSEVFYAPVLHSTSPM